MNRRAARKLVPRTEDMYPVTYEWIILAKHIGPFKRDFIFKALCVLRGDKRTPYEDFDSENLYDPVAAHEIIWLFIAFCAVPSLRVEGVEVDNAYPYGKLYISIVMEQPTNSTGVIEKLNHAFESARSLYDSKQAVMLRGSLIDKTLQY